MKKLVAILLVSISFICLMGCEKSEYVYLFELVEEHLYSEDITVDIPYHDDYVSSNIPLLYQVYISKLYLDEQIHKQNKAYIKKEKNNEDFKNAFKITSCVGNEQIAAYIYPNGKVLVIVNNDSFYESGEGIINYSELMNIIKIDDLHKSVERYYEGFDVNHVDLDTQCLIYTDTNMNFYRQPNLYDLVADKINAMKESYNNFDETREKLLKGFATYYMLVLYHDYFVDHLVDSVDVLAIPKGTIKWEKYQQTYFTSYVSEAKSEKKVRISCNGYYYISFGDGWLLCTDIGRAEYYIILNEFMGTVLQEVSTLSNLEKKAKVSDFKEYVRGLLYE